MQEGSIPSYPQHITEQTENTAMSKYRPKNFYDYIAHQFNGTSTDVARFEHWLESGIEPRTGCYITTHDIRDFDYVGSKGVLHLKPNDWLVLHIPSGAFLAYSDVQFKALFEPVP